MKCIPITSFSVTRCFKQEVNKAHYQKKNDTTTEEKLSEIFLNKNG